MTLTGMALEEGRGEEGSEKGRPHAEIPPWESSTRPKSREVR